MASAENDRIYQIDMTISNTVYTSGASPYNGVSPFAIAYPDVTGLPTGAQTEIDLAKLRPSGRVYSLQMTSIEPLYATTITGNTIEVSAMASNDGTTWSDTQTIFSTLISNVLSQVTGWTPSAPARYYKFQVSGGTIFGSLAGTFICH